MTNVYALQTARAGSKSVKSKNTMYFDDKPLFQHPIEKALNSKLIKRVYISTDIYLIKRNCDNLPYKIIPRPEDLAGDDSSHHDVMIHGLAEIERMEREPVDILAVLLGNSLGAEGTEIDAAVQFLIDNPEYDSDGEILPTFNIRVWNGRTQVGVQVRAVSRAHWTFDQPTRGGMKSHLTYNEYPLDVVKLEIDDEKGVRTRKDWGTIRGNAEHSWGLLH